MTRAAGEAQIGGADAAGQMPDLAEVRYQKNRRAAAQVYVEAAERLNRKVPTRIRRLAEGA